MTRASVYEREGAEMVLPRRLVRSSDRALRQQIIHVCQCGAVHICGDACPVIMNTDSLMICRISGQVLGAEEAMSWRKCAKSKPSLTSDKSDPNAFRRREGRVDTTVQCRNIHVSQMRRTVEGILTELCHGPVRKQQLSKRCAHKAKQNAKHNKRIIDKGGIIFLHQMRDNAQPHLREFNTAPIVDTIVDLNQRLQCDVPFTYFVLATLYLLRSEIRGLPHFSELVMLLPETNTLHMYNFEGPVNKNQFTSTRSAILKSLKKKKQIHK